MSLHFFVSRIASHAVAFVLVNGGGVAGGLVLGGLSGPANVDAQEPATHRFFGSFGTGGFGFPVDDLAMLGPGVLITQDEDGTELARADVAPTAFGIMGAWQIDVPVAQEGAAVFFILADYPVPGARSAPEPGGVLEAGGETELAILGFQLVVGCVARVLPLNNGFQLVGWAGGDGVQIGSLLLGQLGLTAFFQWDGASQSYRGFREGLPPGLNQFTGLNYGDAFWAFREAGDPAFGIPPWRQPVTTLDEGWIDTETGWNILTWTGPNGTDIWDAVGPPAWGAQSIAQSPFIAAFDYDNTAKEFLTFDPRLPESLRTLKTLNHGDPVWLLLAAGLQWHVPADGINDPCGRDAPAAAPATISFPLAQVDVTALIAVGPPGQMRGNDYKGHGYFRVTDNDTRVVAPIDATLFEGSRYIENGEVQYLVYFRMADGRVFIFDHLLEPSERVLAAFADAPEPVPNDSRTNPLIETAFVAGEPLAAAIGTRANANAFVDFGVYDLSQPNAASQQPGFAGDTSTWRDANALCWYDMFPADDSARIRAVVGQDQGAPNISDVCSP